MAPLDSKLWLSLLVCTVGVIGVVGYSETPRQYHIQTDEGPDRYFRFQTYNGQFRKEKRFEDGTVVGTYGWVDPLGLLRLYDYIADTLGYRIVRQRTMQVSPVVEPPPQQSTKQFQRQPVTISQPVPQTQTATQSQVATSVVTQPQPVTQPHLVTRPLPPTQLRPVSSLRPVPKPQAKPFSAPPAIHQPQTLRPILIPLSQTGPITPSLHQVQPASLRPQLLTVRQTVPSATPVPLIPILNNNLIRGKDFESNADETTTLGSFGDRTEIKKPSDVSAGKRERGGGRFRGKPLAQKRQSVPAVPNEAVSSGNRGSVRFKGLPLSSAVHKGTAKRLQPVPLNPTETETTPAFGTFIDSQRNSGIDSVASSTNSDSHTILRQQIDNKTSLPTRIRGSGTDMWIL